MDTGAWGEPGTGERQLAEVAHDLRVPLALILAHCERLTTTLADRDELAEIGQIRDTASRMARQVDGLVHAAPAARAPFDATVVATSVVELFMPLATARGRALTLDCSDAPAIVLADAGELELALQNVVDNALRHARALPVRVSVHVGLRHVSIGVADDGPGIPPGQRRAVLEPRAQGIGGAQISGGAGLGLGIANRVIRSYGGRIRIGDAPEGGALVTLQLPSQGPALTRRRRRPARPSLRTVSNA